jgi:hypothetical protein
VTERQTYRERDRQTDRQDGDREKLVSKLLLLDGCQISTAPAAAEPLRRRRNNVIISAVARSAAVAGRRLAGAGRHRGVEPADDSLCNGVGQPGLI